MDRLSASSPVLMLVVTSTGAVIAGVTLAYAAARGRLPPTRRWPWAIGLVVLSVPAAFLLLAGVAAVAAGDVWMLVGVAGLWCVIGTAWLRPRLGAYLAFASAALMPLVMWGAESLTRPNDPLPIGPGHGLAAYSVRTVIAGALFLWGSWVTTAAPSPQRDGGDDPGVGVLLEAQGDRARASTAHEHR